jgi:carboxyl-terminal processing protease
MTEVASAFLPAGKSLGRFTDRNGRVQFEPYTRAVMLFAPDAIKTFNAPVVILTSERTSSAAEIFVAALKEARRARVIGQNTCGCVLAIRRRHTLPDGGELDISEMDYRTASGTRLEGAGLVPDETITLERQDLRDRRDRAIERAIEFLQ